VGLLLFGCAGACGERSLFSDQEQEAGLPPRPDAGMGGALRDVELVDSAGFQDALPDAVGDACSSQPGPGPVAHLCVPSTPNECDGLSNPSRFLPNGNTGNGFDDDCDGLVDERCNCGPDFDFDDTRPCWLVPSTQVSLESLEPFGWCREHSIGMLRCVREGSGDATRAIWSGECEGAEQPFPDDVCAPGDFDCDGKEANSRAGCPCPP
jgi:hypothetical protein